MDHRGDGASSGLIERREVGCDVAVPPSRAQALSPLPRAAGLSQDSAGGGFSGRREAHVARVSSGDHYRPVAADVVLGLASSVRVRQDPGHDRRRA